jgi:hypothetical protein
MSLTGSDHPDPPRSSSVEERLARLEAKIEHLAWWRNPGWWGVILSAFVGLSGLAWQTKPWKLFQDEPAKRARTVKLIDGHASAFAKNQWSADLRVVNGTSHDIVVERVSAIFGARSYGQSCRNGQATRVLYPVSQLRTGSPATSSNEFILGRARPLREVPISTACSQADEHAPFPWRDCAPREIRSPSSSSPATAPSGRPNTSSSTSLVLALAEVACRAACSCSSPSGSAEPATIAASERAPAVGVL